MTNLIQGFRSGKKWGTTDRDFNSSDRVLSRVTEIPEIIDVDWWDNSEWLLAYWVVM